MVFHYFAVLKLQLVIVVLTLCKIEDRRLCCISCRIKAMHASASADTQRSFHLQPRPQHLLLTSANIALSGSKIVSPASPFTLRRGWLARLVTRSKMRAVSLNSLPYDTNWSPKEEDFDPSDAHKPLLLQIYEPPSDKQSSVIDALYKKVTAVNWRNVITIIIAVVDYFLVYASISLIGTFFPTEVILCIIKDA